MHRITRDLRYSPLVALVALALFPSLKAALGSASDDRTAAIRRALEEGSARNVLLFIGDGLGDSEITMARNYEVGAAGRLAMD